MSDCKRLDSKIQDATSKLLHKISMLESDRTCQALKGSYSDSEDKT
jgi:hypothetical protein